MVKINLFLNFLRKDFWRMFYAGTTFLVTMNNGNNNIKIQVFQIPKCVSMRLNNITTYDIAG